MTNIPFGIPPTNVRADMPPVKSPRAPDTAIVPLTPPRALLVSMAMRLHHDFGADAVYVPGTGQRHPLMGGFTSEEREVVLTEMAQIYEEVVGRGFYQWDRDANQRGGLYAL